MSGMIEAQHSPAREAILRAYLWWLMRRLFFSVGVVDFAALKERVDALNGAPIILFANHHSWWDGFFDFLLVHCLGRKLYLMMEEANLRKVMYFQKCGVFGVDLESKRGKVESFRYAVKRAQEPGNCLVLYPHGRLVMPWDEPPPFRPGLARIGPMAPGAWYLPVWREMFFGKRARAEVRIGAGNFIRANSPVGLSENLQQTQIDLHGKLYYQTYDSVKWFRTPPSFTEN